MTFRANEAEETLDDLLQGRLRIYQKASGFRYSIDALLLAHFAAQSLDGRSAKAPPVRVLDLGSGTGGIPLVLSQYNAIDHIFGVEIVPALVEMSTRSVSLNKLEDKITIIEGDIRDLGIPEAARGSSLRKHSFDLIVSNPPYRRKGEGKINPDRHKAIARHELAVNLEEILEACAFLIKSRGAACFIYGANRMTDLITGLRGVKIEPSRIRFVHSRENESAKMLLVEARQSGPADIKIERPLIVYKDETNYSDEVNAIFEGPSGQTE